MNSLPILEKKQWAQSPCFSEEKNKMPNMKAFYVKLMNRNNLSAVA